MPLLKQMNDDISYWGSKKPSQPHMRDYDLSGPYFSSKYSVMDLYCEPLKSWIKYKIIIYKYVRITSNGNDRKDAPLRTILL